MQFMLLGLIFWLPSGSPLFLGGPPSDGQNNQSQTLERVESTCAPAAAAFAAGQFQRAADLARLCLLREGDSSQTYKLLALSSFMLQRPDDFQANMEKAAALDPRDPGAHYHLGRFFYEKKLYKDAQARFRLACELDPENFKAFYFSGLVRQGSAEEQGAVDDFRKSIEIIERKQIRYGWPFADLGELLIARGEFENGLSWIYRGTRNDPSLPYAYFAYARALFRKETSFEVENALRRAVTLDPGYAEAYYLLGRYYAKAGDKERAGSAFAKFEELRKNPIPSPFGLRR